MTVGQITVSGTMTFPIFPGGPEASLVIGSPTIDPSDTGGITADFDRCCIKTLIIEPGHTEDISFETITSVNFTYTGVEGSSILITAGGQMLMLDNHGFILITNPQGITSYTIQNVGTEDALVSLVLAGE